MKTTSRHSRDDGRHDANFPFTSLYVGIRSVGEGATQQQSGGVVLPSSSSARFVLQTRIELHQHENLSNFSIKNDHFVIPERSKLPTFFFLSKFLSYFRSNWKGQLVEYGLREKEREREKCLIPDL